jgi:hypothetical protein
MAKCEMLLSKFGNYLGQTVEFSRILIHLSALKATPNISEHKRLGGIEPLKLAFPAQVTCSVNQVSIQFQLHKLM